MSRLVRPEHSEIAFKELRFLITDRPNDALMDRFIEARHSPSLPLSVPPSLSLFRFRFASRTVLSLCLCLPSFVLALDASTLVYGVNKRAPDARVEIPLPHRDFSSLH